jgi:hypothetical protein
MDKLNLMRNDTTLCDYDNSFLQKQVDLQGFKLTTTSATTTPYSYSTSALTIVTSTAVVSHMLESTNNSGPSETSESTHTGSDDAHASKRQQNLYRVINYLKHLNKYLNPEIQYLKQQLCEMK